jgi:hypothetical protein
LIPFTAYFIPVHRKASFENAHASRCASSSFL